MQPLGNVDVIYSVVIDLVKKLSQWDCSCFALTGIGTVGSPMRSDNDRSDNTGCNRGGGMNAGFYPDSKVDIVAWPCPPG